MDIGPVSPVRPVAAVRPVRASSDLSGVFAVEFRRQDGSDSETLPRRASRGLEDEDDLVDPDAAEPRSESKVSFFA